MSKLQRRVQREFIGLCTVPGKYGLCAKFYIAEMPEFLTLVRVRQMNLEHRHVDGLDGVQYCNRAVCVPSRIQQDRRRPDGLCLVKPVDQMPFVIGLAKVDFGTRRGGAIIQSSGDIVERIMTVDFRLSRSQQIQVRAIQNKNNGPVSQKYSPDNVAVAVAERVGRILYGGQMKSEMK